MSRSPQAVLYRHLYKTKRWRELREWQLLNFPWCEISLKQGRRVKATVVNHRKPHRGDPRLFFDPANLQSLSKGAHDGVIASRERGGGRTPVDVNGFPIREVE